MSNEHEHKHETPVTPSVPPTTPQPPKKERPDLSKVTPYKVTRNGVEKSLTPFAGTRGAWDGVVYQAPQIAAEPDKPLRTNDTFLTNLEWYGLENIIKIVNVFSKRMAQDYHADAIPEKDNQPGFPEGCKGGIFHLETFLKSMENFAAAQFRLSELMELYEDAVKAYTNSTGVDFVNEVVACNGDPVKIQALKDRTKKLSDTVNQYKLEIEERRNRRSKEVETETVQPE